MTIYWPKGGRMTITPQANRMTKITDDQVETWMGLEPQFGWIVSTLTSIANGEYTPESLRDDIIETITEEE